MEKLGVFGGTFNPIHNGHLSLCTQICDALGLSKVLLIPTAIPPHKRVDGLADGRHRLAMCRLAVQGDPRFFVCDLELRRQGNSYTADTLRELEEIYPNTRFFLLMGTDMSGAAWTVILASLITFALGYFIAMKLGGEPQKE